MASTSLTASLASPPDVSTDTMGSSAPRREATPAYLFPFALWRSAIPELRFAIRRVVSMWEMTTSVDSILPGNTTWRSRSLFAVRVRCISTTVTGSQPTSASSPSTQSFSRAACTSADRSAGPHLRCRLGRCSAGSSLWKGPGRGEVTAWRYALVRRQQRTSGRRH